MRQLRSRSIRRLAMSALVIPITFAMVLALPGMASAKGVKPPKAVPVSCTGLGGSTLTAVTLSGCSNKGTVSATGGSGHFTTFSLNPAGGSNVVAWANGATTTFTDAPTVLTGKADKCPGQPATIEAKLTGGVTGNTNPPSGVAGVKNPVKAFVCATPDGSGFDVTLAKATFKI